MVNRNGNIIYRTSGYAIKEYYNKHSRKSEFVVYNCNKDKSHHTHVNNFYMAKKLIWCASHKIIDKKVYKPYLLISLKRISSDSSFICEIDKKLEDFKQ